MIIGITGFAGSGKDTVAQILMKINPSFVKVSFAGKLKDITATLFDWNRQKLEGITPEDRDWREQEDKELSELFGTKITPRGALKILGVGLKKTIKENIWALLVKKQIKTLKNVIITDVRFPDEIKMIKEMGGIILEVKRRPDPDWYKIAAEYNQNRLSLFSILVNYKLYKEMLKIHPSERLWIGINKPFRVIPNYAGIKSLEGVVKTLYEKDLKNYNDQI